jgi:hypothetical protein
MNINSLAAHDADIDLFLKINPIAHALAGPSSERTNYLSIIYYTGTSL